MSAIHFLASSTVCEPIEICTSVIYANEKSCANKVAENNNAAINAAQFLVIFPI